MKRIIVAAILTVIFAVGTVTSFIVNDLPNVTQWMQTNEAQFKKPPKHDGPHNVRKDIHHDGHMEDGKYDGLHREDRRMEVPNGPMNGGPQGGPPAQDMPTSQGNGQVPPQGNAPAVPQGAPAAPQDGQAAPVPQAAPAQ